MGEYGLVTTTTSLDSFIHDVATSRLSYQDNLYMNVRIVRV